jgi:serine/threonine-protein kinase
MVAGSPPDTDVGQQALPAEDRDRRGETLAGRYELVRRVGQGSMGDVYEARHLQLERRFAVKLLRGEHLTSERMLLRFMLEMRAAGCLESIHIVPAIDCGHARDGAPFYVMELLRGEDLGRLLNRERRLAVGRAVELAIDVCHGLEVAHARGLVHRDLKPQNVFVARDERGRELAKILDFGLVRLDRSHAAVPSASILGTVSYMAPEQLQNPALVDARADIYALGAVLYECLAGVPPHPGDTVEQILARRAKHAPRRLAELRDELPRGLDEVVRRALAHHPSDRFRSAADFAAALESHAPAAEQLELPGRPEGAASIPPVSSADDTEDADRTTDRGSWQRTLGSFALASALLGALWCAVTLRAPNSSDEGAASVAPTAALGAAARPHALVEPPAPRDEPTTAPAPNREPAPETAAAHDAGSVREHRAPATIPVLLAAKNRAGLSAPRRPRTAATSSARVVSSAATANVDTPSRPTHSNAVSRPLDVANPYGSQ